VANGRKRRRFFSTSSHFPPRQLHLDLHFLFFDIKVLLYHGLKPLFTHALPFPWLMNYDRTQAPQMNEEPPSESSLDLTLIDALPSPKLGPRWALVSKTMKLWGLKGTLPALSTKRGRGACWSSRMGLGKGTSFSYILEPTSSQPNKLITSHSKAPLVLGQATGDSRLTRLITAQTWGKAPPSPT